MILSHRNVKSVYLSTFVSVLGCDDHISKYVRMEIIQLRNVIKLSMWNPVGVHLISYDKIK